MIEVGNHIIAVEVSEIVIELRNTLQASNVSLFNKIIHTGDNLQTQCPFHGGGVEHKPSFGILTKDSGRYKAGQCHCFACGWSGSLPEMISNIFGYDDFGLYGEKWLLRNFVTVEVEHRPDILKGVFEENTQPQTYVSDEELESYRVYHPYMWKRKLTPEIVDMFDIGYDTVNECLTFPVRNEQGRTLFIARRSVNTKYFNYPSGVEKPVYGVYEYKQYAHDIDVALICESMIDAMTVWTYGQVAFALNGLGDEKQFEQLRKLPIRKYVLATDMDDRGINARPRIRGGLSNKLVTELWWDKDIAKDINDMTKSQFYNVKEIMV